MRRRATLRLIDANANRAMEGIRVCEDVIRFYWELPPSYRRMRSLRHAIAKAVRNLPIPRRELIRARAVKKDPGRRARASEVSSFEALVVINLQRAKEALRTLEECARVIAPRHAASFQGLRFRTYDVEREVLLRLASIRNR